jgi:hypothetical protein
VILHHVRLVISNTLSLVQIMIISLSTLSLLFESIFDVSEHQGYEFDLLSLHVVAAVR